MYVMKHCIYVVLLHERLMVHSEFIELHRATSLDTSLLCMLRAVHLISHSVRKSSALSDVARCNSMNSELTIMVLDLFRSFMQCPVKYTLIRLPTCDHAELYPKWVMSPPQKKKKKKNLELQI